MSDTTTAKTDKATVFDDIRALELPTRFQTMIDIMEKNWLKSRGLHHTSITTNTNVRYSYEHTLGDAMQEGETEHVFKVFLKQYKKALKKEAQTKCGAIIIALWETQAETIEVCKGGIEAVAMTYRANALKKLSESARLSIDVSAVTVH